MLMLEHIIDAEKALDFFNLDVARYRVEHGMSGDLATMYKRMGQLSNNLRSMKIDIEWLENEFNRLTGATITTTGVVQ